MTLSAGTVSIGVKSDTHGFGASLHNSLKGEMGGIGRLLGGGLMAGIGVAISAVSAVVGVGMKEAMGAEKINAQFAAGIKSTGNAANLSVRSMDDLASSISGYSGQSWESIGNTEKLLQTFVNIKNVGPNKIFDQATGAAANMAAKMGGDASDMAIKLGKALNDPVKGMTALGRVGVQFTQSQKDSIKAMVAHGDTMGAQKVILGELSKEFGGAAKAAGETLPGQLARSKVAFGELSKGVMEGVLPVVTPMIEAVASAFTKAAPKIKEFADVFIKDLKGAIEFVTPILGSLYHAIIEPVIHFITGTAIPAIKNFAKGFQESAGPGGQFRDVIAGIASFFTDKLIPAVTRVYQMVLPALMGLFRSVTSAMNDHKDVIGFIKTAFSVLGDFVTSILLPVLGNLVKFIAAVLGPIFRGLITIIEGVVIPGIKLLVGAVLGIISGILKGAAMAFGWVPGLGPKLRAASADFDAFRDRTNAALDGIKDKTINIGVTMTGADLPSASGGGGMKRKALGGPVMAGVPYIVGEYRPEVFVPDRNGTILPQVPHGGAGGGDVVTNTIVNLDGKVLFHEMQRQSIAEARRNGTSGLKL